MGLLGLGGGVRDAVGGCGCGVCCGAGVWCLGGRALVGVSCDGAGGGGIGARVVDVVFVVWIQRALAGAGVVITRLFCDYCSVLSRSVNLSALMRCTIYALLVEIVGIRRLTIH